MPKASAKKRFVEPYRLSDEQRDAMLAPLAERGLGDAESRDLFAAALAYDIATCYELTTAQPSRSHRNRSSAEPPPKVVQADAQARPDPPAARGEPPPPSRPARPRCHQPWWSWPRRPGP